MNDLTRREAAIVRYALRMLGEAVGHPDQIHHLTRESSQRSDVDDLAIGKREVRMLVGRII